mmetsp:Transcript_8845/g.11615  ORF Transcript_8845/g.11615 Transcript_8845/m.11615 type:complete len:837 (+) Transcript_8845:413-2923(+)
MRQGYVLPILLIFSSSFLFVQVRSVQAKPSSGYSIQRADGSEILIRSKGDFFKNWLEDDQGYSVVKSGQDFYYAEGKDLSGKLIPSNYKVGVDDPQTSGLPVGLKPDGKPSSIPDHGRRKLSDDKSKLFDGGSRRLDAVIGSIPNLVVPIMFSDHQTRTLPSQADIDLLWNAAGGHPTYYGITDLSVKDYYYQQSYGQLEITSTVLDWVVVSGTEAYYAAGESGGSSAEEMELLNEVLSIIDAYVDFSEFDQDGDGYIDGIAFVHSGYGAEVTGVDAYGAEIEDRMWSHKWTMHDPETMYVEAYVTNEDVMVKDYHIETIMDGLSGSQISGIAVGCHETGHFFGLPDLYDTDDGGEGIGYWGVMANSWGWTGTGYNPPSFSAWSKYMLGWLDPTEIPTTGTSNLPDIHSTATAGMISSTYQDGEYLLIENRQAIGSDSDAPASGLLIWHIDEYAVDENNVEGYPSLDDWPYSGSHYQVALMQADGNFDLEMGTNKGDSGDPFSSAGDTLYDSMTNFPSSMGYRYGIITSAGFEIVAGEPGDPFEFIFQESSGFNGTSECSGLLWVELHDIFADSWNGLIFGLYNTDGEEDVFVQTVTMASGSYHLDVCLLVEPGSCYAFLQIQSGSCDSEAIWNLCDAFGGATNELYFCVDEEGVCIPEEACPGDVGVELYDYWGNGWNGYEFAMYEVLPNGDTLLVDIYTLGDGLYEEQCVDLAPNTCYIFQEYAEGSLPSEISFSICGQTGYVGDSLEFCTDDVGSCFEPAATIPPTSLPTITAATAPPTSTATAVEGSSCSGYCNAQNTGSSCWCDNICFNYGDCCDDVCSVCGYCQTLRTST